jgi:hypothetical protein
LCSSRFLELSWRLPPCSDSCYKLHPELKKAVKWQRHQEEVENGWADPIEMHREDDAPFVADLNIDMDNE